MLVGVETIVVMEVGCVHRLVDWSHSNLVVGVVVVAVDKAGLRVGS